MLSGRFVGIMMPETIIFVVYIFNRVWKQSLDSGIDAIVAAFERTSPEFYSYQSFVCLYTGAKIAGIPGGGVYQTKWL